MKVPSLLFAFLLTLSNTGNAFADEVELGAATRCDRDQDTFEIIPVVTTSSTEYDVPVPAGYSEVGMGRDRKIKVRSKWNARHPDD